MLFAIVSNKPYALYQCYASKLSVNGKQLGTRRYDGYDENVSLTKRNFDIFCYYLIYKEQYFDNVNDQVVASYMEYLCESYIVIDKKKVFALSSIF